MANVLGSIQFYAGDLAELLAVFRLLLHFDDLLVFIDGLGLFFNFLACLLINIPHRQGDLFPYYAYYFNVHMLVALKNFEGVRHSLFADIRNVHEAFLSPFEA